MTSEAAILSVFRTNIASKILLVRESRREYRRRLEREREIFAFSFLAERPRRETSSGCIHFHELCFEAGSRLVFPFPPFFPLSRSSLSLSLSPWPQAVGALLLSFAMRARARRYILFLLRAGDSAAVSSLPPSLPLSLLPPLTLPLSSWW